jgi:hypothetical protein
MRAWRRLNLWRASEEGTYGDWRAFKGFDARRALKGKNPRRTSKGTNPWRALKV